MTVSVLIMTLNEEANLPACLASLDWCDDIVVLDSFSTTARSRLPERLARASTSGPMTPKTASACMD